jgi:hypothetical protein
MTAHNPCPPDFYAEKKAAQFSEDSEESRAEPWPNHGLGNGQDSLQAERRRFQLIPFGGHESLRNPQAHSR